MSSDLSAAPRRQIRRDLRVEICWAPADTAGYLRLAKHLFPAKAVRLSRKLAARILILAPAHEQGLELIARYGHNGDSRADHRAFVRWTLAMPGHPPVYAAFSRLLRDAGVRARASYIPNMTQAASIIGRQTRKLSVRPPTSS